MSDNEWILEMMKGEFCEELSDRFMYLAEIHRIVVLGNGRCIEE